MEGQTPKTGTFGSSLANPNPQSASIPQTKTPEAPKQTYEQILKEEDGLDKDFLEERYIVIALATDITINSVYRQVNARYIAERHDSIGGSINSARVLTSNYEEMAAYMPSLIGCSPNAQEYVTRVQRWFNSISIPVDGDGKKLNCSFQWRKKRDYLNYKIDETAIIEEYDNAEKSKIEADKLGKQREMELKQSRTEAQGIIAQAKETAENNAHARATGLHKQVSGHAIKYKSDATKKAALANLKDKSALSDDEVRYVRAVHKPRDKDFSSTALASKFGVSVAAMCKIVSRQTYQDVV